MESKQEMLDMDALLRATVYEIKRQMLDDAARMLVEAAPTELAKQIENDVLCANIIITPDYFKCKRCGGTWCRYGDQENLQLFQFCPHCGHALKGGDE